MMKWSSIGLTVIRLLTLPVILIVGLAALKYCEANAREQYPGQYAQISPDVREWFRSQTSPEIGIPCCSEADGIAVEEDIRGGEYWARGGPFEVFTRVPPEVVIHDPNRNGSPVVWWLFQDGEPRIRCYSPGGGA